MEDKAYVIYLKSGGRVELLPLFTQQVIDFFIDRIVDRNVTHNQDPAPYLSLFNSKAELEYLVPTNEILCIQLEPFINGRHHATQGYHTP